MTDRRDEPGQREAHRPSGAVIDILGSGAWGTALAMVLQRTGQRVRVWGHDAAYAEEIETTRRNPKYLPDIEIPPGIRFAGDFSGNFSDGFSRNRSGTDGPRASVLFSVIPTQRLRHSLAGLRDVIAPSTIVVSCSKGFEVGSLRRPTEVITELLGVRSVVCLSGPSHAEEVSRFLPVALVAASDDPEAASSVQTLLVGDSVRVYTSSDAVGVEVGGATKNVVAIACGVSDGLGFGDNARAALMTRGLHEMSRLGLRLGGDARTFAGLSGMGDLVATCSSTLSRNWTVGYRIGRGESLDAILASTEKVAEGIPTTRSLHQFGADLGLELPITSEVHAVLFEQKEARGALVSLMARESKDEPE